MTGSRAYQIVLLVALAAVAAFLVLAGLGAETAARGYLAAFVFVGMIPVGSLALLLVRGVTGGRWGEDLAPVLVPAARAMPLLILAALPILIFRPTIYDWSALHLEPNVELFYLNAPFFDARTLLALIVWSLLAWSSAWRRPLFAALGLLAHLALISFIPSDWILTIPPGSSSAAFGIGFGIEQIFAALAFAAIQAPQGDEPRANTDLAGLLISALLGTAYFTFMEFLIPWYGNVPDKVKWFASRSGDGWTATVAAAFALGIALPFVAMLHQSVRHQPRALCVVGLLMLVGIALHVLWMIAPAFGSAVLPPAVPAAIALASLMIMAARLCPPAMRGGMHGL